MEVARTPEREPSIRYSINETDFIFRHEFYGGLVHSRFDGTRYELSHEQLTFLLALGHTGDVNVASDIVTQVFPDIKEFEPAVDTALSYSLITENKDISSTSTTRRTPAEVIDILKESYEDSQSRTYLRAPVNLSVYPLMACQLSCKFCYVSEEKWRTGSKDTEQWIDVMWQAKDMGVPFISFLGGDPALYRGMPDLVKACDEIGIKGTMTTNGNRLSERLLDALTTTRNITPVVSIQSLDGFHESITGRTYREPLESLERLHSAGKRCNINTVYTEQSYSQVEAIADLCAKLEVGKFTIGVFTDINNSSVRVPPFSEYRKLHEHMLHYIQERGYTFDFQTEGCQLYTAYPEIDYKISTHYEKLVLGCDAGQSRCEIMHDGQILGCALLNKERWGGANVFEAGFQEAWDESHKLHKIRTVTNRDAACNSGDCSFSSFCNGGCPAHNEINYGDPEIAGDTRCEIRDDIIATHGVSRVTIRRKKLLEIIQ